MQSFAMPLPLFLLVALVATLHISCLRMMNGKPTHRPAHHWSGSLCLARKFRGGASASPWRSPTQNRIEGNLFSRGLVKWTASPQLIAGRCARKRVGYDRGVLPKRGAKAAPGKEVTG